MGTSHTLVGIAATIASFALVVTASTFGDTLGADASDAPYTGLWVYTPYVDPGDRVAAKLLLKGGDRISVAGLAASIDGQPAAVEKTSESLVTPSKRFAMGKATLEVRVTVPAELATGAHRLAHHAQGRCSGSSYSRACNQIPLESEIHVGGAARRLGAVARALLALLLVGGGLRRSWRPIRDWMNAAGKNNAGLAPAIILSVVLWAWSGYPLFAQPLAAALGTSHDAFFVFAMLVWLVATPCAVRWKRKTATSPPVAGAIHFVAATEVEPVSEQRGYRDGATRPVPRKARSLDEVGRFLEHSFGVRLRRSGKRLVPRLFRSAPVTFSAADPADIGGHPLEVQGDFGYLILFAVKLAERFGDLDLELDGKSTRVTKGTPAVVVSAALCQPKAG